MANPTGGPPEGSKGYGPRGKPPKKGAIAISPKIKGTKTGSSTGNPLPKKS